MYANKNTKLNSKKHKRKNIHNHIKHKIFKENMHKYEKLAIYIFIVLCFLIFLIFYNKFFNFNVSFYGTKDIQTLDVSLNSIKYISENSNNNAEFNKTFTMYAKQNNYFSEGAYIEDYKKIKNLTFIENIKFYFFNLDKENKAVYNMIKTINNDINCLPIDNKNYNIFAINSFNINKNIYNTIFTQKNNFSNSDNLSSIVQVQSVSNGIIKDIRYNTNGLEVTIQSNSGNEYIYSNLENVNVVTNENISFGDCIGSMGNTKQIDSVVSFEQPKLSFAIKHNSQFFDDIYVNPYPFLYLEALRN